MTDSAPLTAPANRLLYAACIFLSAFLLFAVQPLVAKEILPWFGGSAAVWTTCMLFFQMLLLAGYAYAHWLNGRRHWVHAAVLLAALLLCRIVPWVALKPTAGGDPLVNILILLSVTVGLPYFTLAATSPLLQMWYARQHHGIPYRFFALSNLASMLALLSYPLLIEPLFALHVQAWAWSGAFVVCAALNYSLYRTLPTVVRETDIAVPADPPRLPERLLWVALPACASGLLLAVTNHITQNIAAIPLFWVVPLAAYLLSFILTFDDPRWYLRPIWMVAFIALFAAMGYAVDERSNIQQLSVLMTLFIGGLFAGCMVCHGELANIKPAPRWLTGFYLHVALGGAVGGLFVAVVAPAAFPALWEFPILLALTPGVILCKVLQDHRNAKATLPGAASPGLWPWSRLGRLGFWPPWTTAWLAVIALGAYLAHGLWEYRSGTRVLTRNFYGALAVSDYEDPAVRELSHGTIIHGEQYLDPATRKTPLTYYSADTGIGMLMTDLERRGPVKLGVIGLGAGTMAGWGRSGDEVRFYEINRAVIDIARTQFSYLQDCRCEPAVVLGDARLSLENEPSRQFDVLVVDAFSGDSIPVHLLTREAFAVYFHQLGPDGILAVHVTNTYLDLGRPVAALARSLGREAHLIVNVEDQATTTFAADWVLIGRDVGGRFPWIHQKEAAIPAGGRIWTDDFSNLWGALRHDR